MFDTVTEIVESDRSTRYCIECDHHVLSYADVIDLWQNDVAFQEHFTTMLANSPFDGFRWETPSLTNESVNRPFECVLVNTPEFANRRTDRNTYTEYFTDFEADNGVISFPNLRKDATLVVPSPRSSDNHYGHLAAFVRGAPKAQVNSLWCVLARTIKSCLSETPIWVSTAGGGVA